MKHINIVIICLYLIGLSGCQPTIPSIEEYKQDYPAIYPDYREVTIPVNIAPLHFGLTGHVEDAIVLFTNKQDSFQTNLKDKTFGLSMSKWKKLLKSSTNQAIKVSVFAKEKGKWVAYKPFNIYVTSDSIDPYLVYRKIAPGYELWKDMGIYQRNLQNFDETPILENDQTSNNCMNCHSFCNQQPNKFLFHMRQKLAGTYLIDNKKIKRLNTEILPKNSSFVYPSWHPSGRFVAFSTNSTKQVFHSNSRNRIEVYDENSDIVIYDIEKQEIITSETIHSKDAFETFPTFSADGTTLYFCKAQAQPMPDNYYKVKYSLCSVSFDFQDRSIGQQTDTLYSSIEGGKSASFPRISPDGHYLLYTLSQYGNFSIWHKDADLYWIDLRTHKHRRLKEVNSSDVESYHSWSSNSRWFVFSSRRDDGLYTRLYIAHASSDGQVGKPFMLPQPRSYDYEDIMQSYNIPEFVKGAIEIPSYAIKETAQNYSTPSDMRPTIN